MNIKKTKKWNAFLVWALAFTLLAPVPAHARQMSEPGGLLEYVAVKNGVVKIIGRVDAVNQEKSQGLVSLLLLKPGMGIDTLEQPDGIAHVNMIPVDRSGRYVYQFQFMGAAGRYTLFASCGGKTAALELDPTQDGVISADPLSNGFGVPEVYPAILGDTVQARFEERVAELPEELPVVQPRAVTGKTQFFVAPNGSDAADGAIHAPFQTIARAAAAVKALTDAQRAAGVVIWLRGGNYRLDSPLDLRGLAGQEEAPLFISAYGQEKVSITNSYDIAFDQFSSLDDAQMLQRLPEAAHGKVMVADLAACGITDMAALAFRQSYLPNLYINGQAGTPARWPNAGEVAFGTILDPGPVIADGEPDDGRGFAFRFDDARPLSWQNTGDIWINGAPHAEYSRDNYQIREINAESQSIRTVQHCYHGARILPDNTYYYFNIFEELDEQNEWFIDRQAGKLYLYLENHTHPSSVQIAAGEQNLIALEKTENVILNGIRFEAVSGNAVTISDGQKNIVQNCVFDNIQGSGVAISDKSGGQYNGVINSVFSNIGGAAVKVSAAQSRWRKLQPSKHFVMNNEIDGAQIQIQGVGIFVAHNRLKNTGGDAIFIIGAECIVEYNEIFGFAAQKKDCGAIYLGGFRNRGNHIRYNYIHDASKNHPSPLQAGIYFDDMSGDCYAYGNILKAVPTSLKSHNGHEVVFFNNIVMEEQFDENGSSLCALTVDHPNYYAASGQASWTRLLHMETANLHLLHLSLPAWTARYPTFGQLMRHLELLADMDDGKIAEDTALRGQVEEQVRKPRDFYMANNLMVNHSQWTPSQYLQETLRGFDTNVSVAYDPGFADMDDGKYDISEDAAVYTLIPGFLPPPFSRMGRMAQASGTELVSAELAVGKDDICVYPNVKNHSDAAVNVTIAAAVFCNGRLMDIGFCGNVSIKGQETCTAPLILQRQADGKYEVKIFVWGSSNRLTPQDGALVKYIAIGG